MLTSERAFRGNQFLTASELIERDLISLLTRTVQPLLDESIINLLHQCLPNARKTESRHVSRVSQICAYSDRISAHLNPAVACTDTFRGLSDPIFPHGNYMQ